MTSDGIHTSTYDAEGNITGVEYLYDHAGKRKSTWLLNQPGLPAGFGEEGRIYWNGNQIAHRALDGNTYFEHRDWIGTERLRTSYTGASHAQYRQYSNTQGRWLRPDPYYGSYDFANPQSLNRYVYVLNNPLAHVDPSGLTLCDYGDGDIEDTDDDWDECSATGGTPVNVEATVEVDGNGGGFIEVDYTDLSGTTLLDYETFAPSKDPCDNPILAAAGVDARQQIATAQSYILNSAGPFGSLIAYGTAVNTGGPLDIKNLPGHSPQNPIDVAAGNISFGITCPFGATFCQVAAGLAQGAAGLLNQLSGGRYGHGAPGPASTYFDSPSDNAQIKVGQAMRAAGCHE